MGNIPLSMHLNIVHHQLENRLQDYESEVKDAEMNILEWNSSPSYIDLRPYSKFRMP